MLTASFHSLIQCERHAYEARRELMSLLSLLASLPPAEAKSARRLIHGAVNAVDLAMDGLKPLIAELPADGGPPWEEF